MESMENKISDICAMSDTIITALKAELAKGIEHADANELGEAADMIKDFAEAECKLREACYYKTVVEAMKHGEEEERYGYTEKPVPRNTWSDVRYKPMVGQEPYIEDYLNEGIRPHDKAEEPENRYGRAYRDYKTAKRHYTATNSPNDKEAMTIHATEHVADTISTIRDIWRSADTDLKKRMKTDLTNLVGEMTV